MADVVKTSYMDRATLGYSEYLCKNKAALDAQSPKPGDRAMVVSEGKVYFCVETGTWLEWAGGEGPEPIPTGFPYNFTMNNFEQLDEITGLLLNKSEKFGYQVGKNYKLTITYKGTDYSEITDAQQDEDTIILQYYFNDIPPEAQPHYASMFGDGVKVEIKDGDMNLIYGDFGTIFLNFDGSLEHYQAFKDNVSKITLEEVSE